MKPRRLLLTLAIGLILVSACAAPSTPPAETPEPTPVGPPASLPDVVMGKILPPQNGCYVGALAAMKVTEEEPFVTAEYLQQFEELSGKPVAIAWAAYAWEKDVLLKQRLDEVEAYGAVPVIGLRPQPVFMDDPWYIPDYALQKIIDGNFDCALSASIADVIKEYGKPVMISFAGEMNGDWYSYSGIYQGADTTTEFGDPSKADGPERYVAAYRHIIELFRNRKVNNVTWLFHPNDISYPEEPWNSIEAYYPGDEYIDWVGISLYGADSPDAQWDSFETLMDTVYNELISLFPNKPLMLAEWGVGGWSEKGNKTAWITEAFATLQSRYTGIKCAIYWHEKWENDDGSWSDLRVNSSDKALNAYRNGISSDYFIGCAEISHR